MDDTTNPETSKVNMSISKWQKSKPVSKWNNPSDTLVDKLNNKTIIAPTMTINKSLYNITEENTKQINSKELKTITEQKVDEKSIPIQQGTYVISKNDVTKLNNLPNNLISKKLNDLTKSKENKISDVTVKEIAVDDVIKEIVDDCEEIKLSDDVTVNKNNEFKTKVEVWTEENKKTDDNKNEDSSKAFSNISDKKLIINSKKKTKNDFFHTYTPKHGNEFAFNRLNKTEFSKKEIFHVLSTGKFDIPDVKLLRTCSLPDLAEENLDDSIDVPKIKKTPEMWAEIFDKKSETKIDKKSSEINASCDKKSKSCAENHKEDVKNEPEKTNKSEDLKVSEDKKISEDIEVNSVGSEDSFNDTNFSDDLASDDDLLQNEMKKLLLSDTADE